MASIDLSEDQILDLLRGAEQRLKQTRQNGHQDELIPNSSIHGNSSLQPYIRDTRSGAVIDPKIQVSSQDRKLSAGIKKIEDPVSQKRNKKEKKPDAGSSWYNLPRTIVTPEFKRDLQLLRMRSVLDPKRFYKKENSKAQIPEFSQVGTIIEGPTEFFSARLSNKERKRTFVEEVLSGEKQTGRFRAKYSDIQAAKTSGKKAHYQRMKELRRVKGSKG